MELGAANGELRDMVCRSLMLELQRAGHLTLPPKKFEPPNPLAVRQRPEAPSTDQTPVEATLSRISKLQFVQVRRGPLETLFNSPIEWSVSPKIKQSPASLPGPNTPVKT